MFLMTVMRKKNGSWALGDFGFCVERISGRLRPSSKVRMTFETCAPELLEASSYHNERVDIWGFGCVSYALARGKSPFGISENYFQLVQRFRKMKLDESEIPLILPNT